MKSNTTTCPACGANLTVCDELIENNGEILAAGEELWLTCDNCKALVAVCQRDGAFEAIRIVQRKEQQANRWLSRFFGALGLIGMGMFGWLVIDSVRTEEWWMAVAGIGLMPAFLLLMVLGFANTTQP